MRGVLPAGHGYPLCRFKTPCPRGSPWAVQQHRPSPALVGWRVRGMAWGGGAGKHGGGFVLRGPHRTLAVGP